MTVWTALLWGGFASASLFVGQALAKPMSKRRRATGLVMGFGAGTLLSAVAYELIPETNIGLDVGVLFLFGAFTYYAIDRIVDRRGGQHRQSIIGKTDDSSGAAMFIGALLDGIPEAFIIGTSLAMGGEVGTAFVIAVFVSNIPEGIAGTISLQAVGYKSRRILFMWAALTVVAAGSAGVGFVVADMLPEGGSALAQAFAAGAVLTMLADSMIPEGYEHGGRTVGLLTVVGYFVGAWLAVVD